MKLQHMIIIFLIIMLPLALILSQYTSLQIDTLLAKTKYDTALLSATSDTMSAFELNTLNSKASSVVGEEIRDLEAVISTFATSLSSGLGMSNALNDQILSYVPAMVFGLYDGYYIYSQNDTGTGRELKPYVYYTKTYKYNNLIDITIAYSLDNYVSIYGTYGINKTISASGYLVVPEDIEISPEFAYVMTTDEERGTTQKVIDPGTKSGGQKSWVRIKSKYDNNIYYDIGPETIYENETVPKSDEIVLNKAKDSTEAMMYYYEAYQFTKLYNEIVGKLGSQDKATLLISRDNDPEDEYSAFMNEKINVMKDSITKNLNNALYNYEGGVSENYEMPQLKGEDWEKILNNISITAFLKDIQVGATRYNNYVVVNSTTNQKYNSAKSIDFIEYVNDASKGLTSYGYYHKITCDELIKDIKSGTISEIIGYASVDFERYRYAPEESNEYFYYYKHNEYADYNCEVESIESQSVATIEEYITDKTKNEPAVRNKILKSYYTAVGRIRYGLIKASSHINLDKEKSFAVRYFPNGGSWSKGNPERVATTKGKLSTISDTPVILGKLFMGWSTDSNATVAEVKVGDAIYGETGDTIDLYAVYADQYIVEYHTNGGEGGPSPNRQTKISGIDYTISTLKPRREGSVFLGWSTNPSATSPEYVGGDIYSEDRGLVLYAVWTNQTVKVQYNTKGGSIVTSQEKAIGATIKLEGTPVLIGSTFIGWSTTQNGRTPEYLPGSDYSENVNKTLYAIWDTTTFRVTYNGNGGDLPAGLQNPSSCTKTYGFGYLIPKVEPVRNGYNFVGWSKDPNDLAPDSKYAPGSVYTDESDLNLYAIWEGEQYWVVYDANGGTNAPEAQTTNKNNDITITNDKPNRTGYEFQGWSANINATESQIQYRSGQNYTDRTSVRLYAVWKRNEYTITYDANGGTQAPGSQTKRHGENIYITSSQPTKIDNHFVGWSRNKDSETVDYYSNQVYRENESVTLYAVWSISRYYSVIYHLNGGSEGPNAEMDILAGTNTTISTVRPTRNGYTFQGWSTSENATVPDNRYAPGAIYSEYQDLDLYAVWGISYKLTYNKNTTSSVGNMPESSTIPARTNVTISSNIPNRSGYRFLGWSENALATTATYTAGSSFIMPERDVTLYAVWYIVDSTPPSVIITLAQGISNSENINDLYVSAGITISNSSGIATRKYQLNTSASSLGTSENSYSYSLSSDNQTITLRFTSTGTYYLHVLAIDNYGNAVEKISIKINVTQHYHTEDCYEEQEWDMCAHCGEGPGAHYPGNPYGACDNYEAYIAEVLKCGYEDEGYIVSF